MGLPSMPLFSSGSADVALRLGLEIGINTSNELKTQRSGSINKLHGQLKQKYQNKTKRRSGRRPANPPPDLRFATRSNSKNTTEKGPGPNANQNTQELPHDTEGVSHRVTKTCRKWTELCTSISRWADIVRQKNTQIAVLMWSNLTIYTLRKRPLRVLSHVLLLASAVVWPLGSRRNFPIQYSVVSYGQTYLISLLSGRPQGGGTTN